VECNTALRHHHCVPTYIIVLPSLPVLRCTVILSIMIIIWMVHLFWASSTRVMSEWVESMSVWILFVWMLSRVAYYFCWVWVRLYYFLDLRPSTFVVAMCSCRPMFRRYISSHSQIQQFHIHQLMHGFSTVPIQTYIQYWFRNSCKPILHQS